MVRLSKDKHPESQEKGEEQYADEKKMAGLWFSFFSASLRGGLFSLLDVSRILTFLFTESHLVAGLTVVIESQWVGGVTTFPEIEILIILRLNQGRHLFAALYGAGGLRCIRVDDRHPRAAIFIPD